MSVIDADGHIIEPEAMFEHLPEEFYPRRPIPVHMPVDTVRGDFNGCWLIEGKSVPNIGSRGRTTAPVPWSERSKKIDVTIGSQTLEDMEARVSDLDRFHIDSQIVFPTMFLAAVAEDVKLEGALFHAYNTYVGQACAKSKGRVRWVALLPFRDHEAAVTELRRASDLGASGIFTMGMVWDRNLADPGFFPIYEEAAGLDLPICIHLGWGSPQVTQLFSDSHAFFCSAIVPVMWGFMYTMGAGLLTRFPKLRLGFLETGSAWVPYAIQQIRRRVEPPTVIVYQGQRRPVDNAIDRRYYRDPEEFFRSGRAFVNCEGDEDFDYLLKHVGEDGLMCSSDFPHGDPSAEENYVTRWRERSDMPERVKEKILGKNAARFFRL
jgi:predicted TIM-barrel fold metal-dependent hydrolase